MKKLDLILSPKIRDTDVILAGCSSVEERYVYRKGHVDGICPLLRFEESVGDRETHRA